MIYGRLFCNLAYEALSREEEELRELNRSNSLARPMSVSQADEVTIHFLITKEAMRSHGAPRIKGEVPYEGSKDKVDICFLSAQDQPCASFELKKISIKDEKSKWPSYVQDDVRKHLNLSNRIGALDYDERYNAVLLITPEKISQKESEALINEATAGLLNDVEFSTSDSIELNRVDHKRADCWGQMRVVVFRARYAALARAADCCS
jgi:hypothetical protein